MLRFLSTSKVYRTKPRSPALNSPMFTCVHVLDNQNTKICLPDVPVRSFEGIHHNPSAGCHPCAVGACSASGVESRGYSCHGCKASRVACLVAGIAEECSKPVEADFLATLDSSAAATAYRTVAAEDSRHHDRDRSVDKVGSC